MKLSRYYNGECHKNISHEICNKKSSYIAKLVYTIAHFVRNVFTFVESSFVDEQSAAFQHFPCHKY